MLNIIILISMDRARDAPHIENLTKTNTWRCYMTSNMNKELISVRKFDKVNLDFWNGIQRGKRTKDKGRPKQWSKDRNARRNVYA